MTIKELKKILKKLPDDMVIGLIDDTDITNFTNWYSRYKDIFIDNLQSKKKSGEMLFITFKNN